LAVGISTCFPKAKYREWRAASGTPPKQWS
jgi:hypothetical protein